AARARARHAAIAWARRPACSEHRRAGAGNREAEKVGGFVGPGRLRAPQPAARPAERQPYVWPPQGTPHHGTKQAMTDTTLLDADPKSGPAGAAGKAGATGAAGKAGAVGAAGKAGAVG